MLGFTVPETKVKHAKTSAEVKKQLTSAEVFISICANSSAHIKILHIKSLKIYKQMVEN